MQPANQLIDVSSIPTGYVKSHQHFPVIPYGNSINYRLQLTAIPINHNIVFNFVFINLGDFTSCQMGNLANDVIRVYKNDNSSLLYECGDFIGKTLPMKVIKTDSAHSIIIELRTNDGAQFKGFLLHYASKN